MVIVVIILLMILIMVVNLLLGVKLVFKWCSIWLKLVVVKLLGMGGLVFL